MRRRYLKRSYAAHAYSAMHFVFSCEKKNSRSVFVLRLLELGRYGGFRVISQESHVVG